MTIGGGSGSAYGWNPAQTSTTRRSHLAVAVEVGGGKTGLAGNEVAFTLRIENAGDGQVNDIVVLEVAPGLIELTGPDVNGTGKLPDHSNDTRDQKGSPNVATLAPGATVIITARTAIRANDWGCTANLAQVRAQMVKGGSPCSTVSDRAGEDAQDRECDFTGKRHRYHLALAVKVIEACSLKLHRMASRVRESGGSMELLEYWKIVRKRLWLLLLLALIGGGSAFYYTEQRVPQYRSTTTLFLNPAADNPLLPFAIESRNRVETLANTYAGLQRVDVGLRLKRIHLCKVTKVGYFRAAIVAASRPVEDDDGTDVLRSDDWEIQRVIGAQREADHRKPAASLAGAAVEERGCTGDLGLGLVGVEFECISQGLGIGNGVCDLPVIEVGGEGDETRFG